MERESREWLVICPHCGHERSVWELGGIRFKARSRGKVALMGCPACGRRGMHRFEHRPG